MEKRIFLLIFFFSIASVYSQHISIDKTIRTALWAELDAYPGSKEAADFSLGEFDYPVSRLKETAPFLLNGMVYGWNFIYTPSDKLRNVDEYFEISEINKIMPQDGEIRYSKPWIENNNLNVWVEFDRTEQMMQVYRHWQKIRHDKIQGRGEGRLSLGFVGIEEAAKNALKSAIRNYYRQIIKNKPKEISGKVLIIKLPRLALKSGHYILELDFFVETDRILEYKQF